MIGYGRGGGGGFGGFPYRSSHQQGQDGRGGGRGNRERGRGGGRGRRQQARRSQRSGNSTLSLKAELQIPSEQRGIIIGRGGGTIKWLRESTNAKIFVPPMQQRRRQRRGATEDEPPISGNQDDTEDNQNQQRQQQHPVLVNTFELSSLLHAFHDISTLLSKSSDDNSATSVPCLVKMRTNNRQSNNGHPSQQPTDMKVSGQLFYRHNQNGINGDGYSNSLLFRGSVSSQSNNEQQSSGTNEDATNLQPQLYAYSIQTTLAEEDVITTIDNVRFVDPTVVDSCQWFYREVMTRSNSNVSNNNNNNVQGSTPASDETGNDTYQVDAVYHLVLLFGADRDKLERLYQAVQVASAT